MRLLTAAPSSLGFLWQKGSCSAEAWAASLQDELATLDWSGKAWSSLRPPKAPPGHLGQSGSAAPQGCPLAPFCLSLWVSSGVRTVERQVADNSCKLSSYMDDRTFYTGTNSCAGSRAWGSWSNTLGMKESTDKIQVCARGPQSSTILNLLSARLGF